MNRILNDLRQFMPEARRRNPILYNFGVFNFVVAAALFAASFLLDIQYFGTHAFYKPVKFGLSIGIYSWTMAWLCHYLGPHFHHRIFGWGITVLLGFEIIYIVIQALRGLGVEYP